VPALLVLDSSRAHTRTDALLRGHENACLPLSRDWPESNPRNRGFEGRLRGVPTSSKGSQAVAIPRDDVVGHSRPSQIFAPFTEDSADRLRTLLTVREVAALLRVSTATVYELCARGKLRHVRVLNAIRVARCDLLAPVDWR
jgi:excisionase family DNA binding protein